MADSVLDEAYERVWGTGPERGGWLSNHAPMAAEALVRGGHGDEVHRFLDSYADRMEERPRGISRIPVDQWRDPLGDPVRTGDWLRYFERELAEEPWRAVLARWWPRLLPGIAAGATHGVIRVGRGGGGGGGGGRRVYSRRAPGAGRRARTRPRVVLTSGRHRRPARDQVRRHRRRHLRRGGDRQVLAAAAQTTSELAAG